MHLNKLLIEHRPRLRCATFYIEFSESITQSELVLKPDNCFSQSSSNRHCGNNLVLCKNVKLDLSSFFSVQTNSVSCLSIEGKKVSFRMMTENRGFSDTLYRIRTEYSHLELNVEENVKYRLQCKNCSAYITNDVCFKRIRELPSENMEMGGWFCHKHSHGVEGTTFMEQSGWNYTKFSPSVTDFFFGKFYILLNSLIFDQNTVVEAPGDIVIKCRKCDKDFGEITSNKTIKIWNENILISGMSCFKITSNFGTFKYLLDNILRDSTCNYHVPLPAILKIVFMTKFAITNTFQYLILNNMDGEMDFYKNVDCKDSNSTSVNIIPTSIFKIMYQKTDNDGEFKMNPTYHTVDISNETFTFLNEYLERNSLDFPVVFRKSCNLTLSYIELS